MVMMQDVYKVKLRLLSLRLAHTSEHLLTSHMTDQKAGPSVH